MEKKKLKKKSPLIGEDLDAGKDWRQKEKGMGGITDSMDMSLSKLQEMVKDRKAWSAAVCRVQSRTWLSYWTTTGGSVVKNLPATQETRIWSLGQEYPLKKEWLLTPVFLPGKSHGQRSLTGYSPWGHKRVGHDLVTKQQQ